MNRKPLIAVATFVILGLVAFVALRQPEKGEGATDRQRPIAKIDPAALDMISIIRNGATTVLRRESGKFRVAAPVAGAADDVAAKAAFDALEKLDLGSLVTQNKEKHGEFEVDEVKGVHVIAKSDKSQQILADLWVGKSVGSGSMVRLQGQDAVWQADAPLRATFDKPSAEFRDRSITTFSTDDAETITVKASNGDVVMLKKNGKAAGGGGGGDDKWDVVTSVPKIDKLDNTVPNGLVSALSSLKTNDFANGAQLPETGLATPSLTVTVALKGGKSVSLLIGKKKGNDEVYLKKPEAVQIYVAKTFNVERINKRPADFKDKSLSDIGEADLKEVAVTHGADSYTLVHEGTAWKATKPPKMALDPGRTPSIGGAFKDWKATTFAEDPSPGVTGLAKPVAVVAIKTMKKEAMSFKIGAETADKQGVYLQSSKSPDVYVVPKWSTDRLLVKLDDLKKK
jgi:hypothetical protein